ncbi:hypothetical protein B0J11DRAFT_475671 [Dendryphion nanum]|uniref:Uncharacterized protein n=1 Tax=Dendryphion nanum TaxID=256645 RepID=A0A9P9EJL6_9PLEO|nr:hypothetical protein B0J11DRAFT_475671 [Dendryphion nanum]
MDNLTPSDLFSPSKARAQRALTQDWAQIDSWLSYKYSGRTVPTFERNDETLKVLRELSTANERADEEFTITSRLEREALNELDTQPQNSQNNELERAIQDHLTPTGTSALNALTTTTLTLSTPSADPTVLAHALIQHTTTVQTLSNHLIHIQNLQSYLSTQHTLLRTTLASLQTDPSFRTPTTLSRQTADQTRQIKNLKTKIREVEDRILGLQSGQGRRKRDVPEDGDGGLGEQIQRLLERQSRIEELEDRVRGLEGSVEEFGGLPPDREGARREVAKLEVELDGLRRRRDGLFEGMVGS